MESQSVRLEREAEVTLWQLSGTLDELRGRMTPGRVVDQVLDYTRGSPAAEFLHNLGREVRENPMPLVVVGIGILWLVLATNRTTRAAIASAADRLADTAEDISVATSEAVTKATEWRQQTAARLSDRAGDAASTVGNTAAEITDRARDAAGGLADGFHRRRDHIRARKTLDYRQVGGPFCAGGHGSASEHRRVPRGRLRR